MKYAKGVVRRFGQQRYSEEHLGEKKTKNETEYYI
jgi:hypothetical protein